MNISDSLLKELVSQVGITGFEIETGISSLILNMLKSNGAEKSYIDQFGNVVGVIGKGSKTLMMEAHLDEVGFMLGKEGGLTALGTIQDDVSKNSEVYIPSRNIFGKVVVQDRGIFFSPKDRSVMEGLSIGDLVSYSKKFGHVGDLVEATSLDNRIGCFVLLSVLSQIKDKLPLDMCIVFLFSAQEETNTSKISYIVKEYNPIFSIVVDAAYAQPVDFGLWEGKMIIPEIGSGCAIQHKGDGFEVKKDIIDLVEKIAQKNNIQIQTEYATGPYGRTNFSKFIEVGYLDGIVINVPVGNQHSQVSVVNIKDVMGAIDLIKEILKEIGLHY